MMVINLKLNLRKHRAILASFIYLESSKSETIIVVEVQDSNQILLLLKKAKLRYFCVSTQEIGFLVKATFGTIFLTSNF